MFNQIVETNPEAFSADYQTLLDAVNGFDAECEKYSGLFGISLTDAAEMIRERNAETPLPMTGEELCAYFCDRKPTYTYDGHAFRTLEDCEQWISEHGNYQGADGFEAEYEKIEEVG